MKDDIMVYRIERKLTSKDREWIQDIGEQMPCGMTYAGPYFLRDNVHALIEGIKLSDESRHPSPSDDGIFFCADVHISAFTSIASLKAWFQDALEFLAQKGYVVGIYYVNQEHVECGKKQCAFLWEKAQRFNEMDISQIL